MTDILVPLAAGCEELEAVTVIDLLRRAEFDVCTAGLADGPLRASRGTGLVPDSTLAALAGRRFDCIALPGGGPGAERLAASEALAELLRAQARAGRWIAAICAAPGVLAGLGLLDGRRATAYPGTLDRFRERPIERVDEPVVVDGHVVTSRGPGTALDFALTIIALLAGEDRAAAVEGPLERPRGHERFACDVSR